MALFRFPAELDPVSGLLGLQRELERAFESPRGWELGLSGRGVSPPVNVFASKEGYIVKVEIPGIPPEAIAIETAGHTLTISGKRDAQVETGASFHRRERGAGQFSRSLQLPKDLDLSRADASCKHGILTIRIPKLEALKPRQISVRPA